MGDGDNVWRTYDTHKMTARTQLIRPALSAQPVVQTEMQGPRRQQQVVRRRARYCVWRTTGSQSLREMPCKRDASRVPIAFCFRPSCKLLNMTHCD